ncbi:MAG: hypothetical protein M1826_006978 [Phylliscum demangeonii]|nr:MAG: hypothetical protein M1826_006978 [Phylliscum demangeonii]
MGLEEQAEEREVLAAIFPEEIHGISETEYIISIKLDVDDDNDDDNHHHDHGGGKHEGDDDNDNDDDDDDDDNDPPPAYHPTGRPSAAAPAPLLLLLHVTYPAAYPDAAPLLALTVSHQHQHPRSAAALDPGALLAALEPVMAENLGMAMVYTLVGAVKEGAEQAIAGQRAARRAIQDERARRRDADENRRFEGERVTRDGFLRWRERFVREMMMGKMGTMVGGGAEREGERDGEREREREREREKEKEKERRLTGRELWERGLVGRGPDEEDLGAAGAAGAPVAPAAVGAGGGGGGGVADKEKEREREGMLAGGVARLKIIDA